MSRASTNTPASTPAFCRAGLTPAPLPTLTLLLTIGSLPLPPRNHFTG
jgi:hypothetical protein